MDKCAQCGREWEEAEKVCLDCGTPLSHPEEREPVTANAEPAGQTEEGPPSVEEDREEEAAETEAPEQRSRRPSFCYQCGNRLPGSSVYCASCGVRVPDIPVTEEIVAVSEPYFVEQEPYDPEESQPSRGPRKKARRVAIAIGTGFALVCCLAAGLLLWQAGSLRLSRTTAGTEYPIIYIQDGESLRFRASDMDRSEVITDAFDAQAEYSWYRDYYLHELSGNGRYLLYLNDYRQYDRGGYNGRGDLYLRDLSKRVEAGKPTDRGTKIASDVTEFYFNEDDSCIFYINTRGDLYFWDFKESRQVDRDVTGVYGCSDEWLLYYKGDEADAYSSYSGSYYTTRDFYITPFSADDRSGRVKIDGGISDMWDWNDSYDRFVYTRISRKSAGGNTFDVYLMDVKTGERQTLISDVDSVVDASAGDGTVLYMLAQPSSISYEDIVDDDLKESDAAIREPELSDYPLVERYMSDYSWYFGGFGSAGGEEEEAFDYQALLEEYERFEEAMELYEEKEERDRIRESIEDSLSWNSTYDLTLHDLYYLSEEGERVRVDTGLYGSHSWNGNVQGDLARKFACYVRVDLNDLPRKSFSEIYESKYWSGFDVERHLNENLTGEMYLTLLDTGEPVRLISREDDLRPQPWSLLFAEDGTGIYYLAHPLDESGGAYSAYSSSSHLYYAPVSDAGVGHSVLVEREVEELSWATTYLGKHFYTTAGRDYTGDLYTLSEATGERLLYDISIMHGPQVYNRGKSLLFLTNYNNDREMGELYLLNQDEDKIHIADDVYDYYYRSDNLIYLLCNYRNGRGDLYVYNGDTRKLVDYDVTSVLYLWQTEVPQE